MSSCRVGVAHIQSVLHCMRWKTCRLQWRFWNVCCGTCCRVAERRPCSETGHSRTLSTTTFFQRHSAARSTDNSHQPNQAAALAGPGSEFGGKWWAQSPQPGPGTEPLVRRSGGKAPEAESCFCICTTLGVGQFVLKSVFMQNKNFVGRLGRPWPP